MMVMMMIVMLMVAVAAVVAVVVVAVISRDLTNIRARSVLHRQANREAAF